MKIDKQVCSIRQGKRLAELGISKDSYFQHICVMPDPTGEQWFYDVFSADTKCDTLAEYICPAYTVAELSVMLDDLEGLIGYDRDNKNWYVTHELPNQPTEAEAKAELLIYFLESEDDYINAEKCNRLFSL